LPLSFAEGAVLCVQPHLRHLPRYCQFASSEGLAIFAAPSIAPALSCTMHASPDFVFLVNSDA
jgi:hypothetical protein